MAKSLDMMYARSFDEVVECVLAVGKKVTILLQGEMGQGKTAVGYAVNKVLREHTLCYFDCTVADLGDFQVPMIAGIDDNAVRPFVRFAPNETLGLHLDKPVILLLDEYGKANRSVRNACLRLMLERKVGNMTLHPDSIVLATTNLGAEGVGDLIEPHQRNRISVLTMRKPTVEEWLYWGIDNEIHPVILSFVKETPQVFQSFEDVSPDDNPYIFHPQAQREAFVTGRSLEKASHWMREVDKIGLTSVTAGLAGTIGVQAALDLSAFVEVYNKLPSLDEIKQTPKTAVVPDTAGGKCMVVYRTLSLLEPNWVAAWVTYLERLPKEVQGLFINGLRRTGYDQEKRSKLIKHPKMFDYAKRSQWLYDGTE